MNLYSANGITLLAKKKATILSNNINTVKLLIALCKEMPGFHSCKFIVFAKFPKSLSMPTKWKAAIQGDYSRHRNIKT
jgi:hypothetical protein